MTREKKKTGFGRCPVCTEELEQSGDLLECPAGDYRAPAKKFSDRWDQFDKKRKGIDTRGKKFKDMVDSLLYDLQEMNIPKVKR